MKLRFYCLLAVLLGISSDSFAQRGKQGNITINNTRIVNEYTTLTTNAAAGSTSITVAASGLNTNSRFPANLAAGDLIMIIQMQGATILGQPNGTIGDPNDPTWGTVTNYNNCGNYEYAEVASVPNATTINLDCGLSKSYSVSGRTQVVRVPRYNTLTLTSPAILTCQAWTGTTGGVLAVEVLGNTTIGAGAKMNVTGTGFRGGAVFTTTGRTTTVLYSCVSLDVGTNKGEGIAGYDTDYTPYGGKFCRAAAANAGGGGNVWNCGGGGGANAGNTASWTGQGNPNTSVAGWSTAWNLESAGFATSSSSGGGRGGYSFSSSNQNATTLGPGTPGITNSWGGAYRYNLGGLGGRPLDYSTGKIFLGGGGGAGEQDNNQAGAGGKGGGIIHFVTYGNITGSGNDSIIADGANGGSTLNTGSNSGKDAAGGAGGGGTIILNATGTVSGVALRANGGIGGHQLANSNTTFFPLTEAEGPGGGGGGGYIAVSNGTPAQQANGGANGITQSPHLTEFLPNGATMGGVGLTGQSITNFSIAASDVTICSGNTATLTATLTGTVPAGTTVTWWDAQTAGSVVGTGNSFTTPVLTGTTTYYVGTCPGTYRIPVIVTVNPGLTITVNSPNICSGQTATLTANGGTTYTWSAGATSTGVNTANVSPTTSTSFTVTGTSGSCSGTAVSSVTVTTPPVATFSYTGSPYCKNGSNPSPTFSGGGIAGTFTSTAGLVINSTTGAVDLAASNAGTYTVTNTVPGSGPCTGTSATATITITNLPVATFNYPNTPYCQTASDPSPAFTGGGSAGTFASTAGLSINSSTGVVDLSASTPGTYTVTNTFAASGGCPIVTASSTITVTAQPVATFSYTGTPYCQTGLDPSPTFSGGGVAGTFTSAAGLIINSTNGSVDLSASTPGSYTVTNTIPASGGCSSAVATATIVITSQPVATFTYTASPYCQSGTDPSPTFSGGGSAGTFSSTAGLSLNAGNGIVDVSASTPGTYVVTNTIPASAGCAAATDTSAITITSPPVATFNYAGPYCQDAADPAPAFTGGAIAGTFSSTAGLMIDPATGVIDLSTSTAGTYTVTNSIAASGGCSATSSTASVTINPVQNASFSYSSSTFCQSGTDPSPTISGTAGGTFSSSPAGLSINVSTGQISLSGSALNTYVVTYTTPGPCPSSGSINITITNAPSANFSYSSATFCQSAADPSPVFSGGGTAGTFTAGSGLVFVNAGTGEIDLSASTPGNYVVTNAIPAAGGCASATATFTIDILAAPNASFSYSGSPYCINGTDPTPTMASGATAGTFSSASGLVINSVTGLVDLSSSTTGTYTVYNIVTAGCGNIDSSVIMINPIPDATITQPSAVCASAAPFNLSAATGGGNWTGTGITNNTNGTFDPSVSGPGAHLITYSIAGVCPSSDTVIVNVTNVLDASITNPPSSCVAGAAFDLTAASAGGVWSGTGIVNTTNGTFDPAASGAGTFTVYYTIGGSCGNIDSATVTITNVADATITQPAAVCETQSAFTLSAVTSGGIWSGNGITDTVAGTYSPSIAGPGTHIITYTISGSCAANDTVVITVNPSSNATITAVASVCLGSLPFNLSAADAGGMWSGNGITDNVNGTFSPSAAGLGSHTIYYIIGGSCGDIDSTTVTVDPPVNTSVASVAPICEGSSPIALSASTPGGLWSGTGITDVNNGIFDPAVSGDGTFVISYGISGACGDTSTTSIIVNPLPVPSATPSITSGCAPLCVQFTETVSTICSTVSYDFGDGNSSLLSDPSHCFNADGIYSVQITCTDANGCSGTGTVTSSITVNAVPVADITITPAGIISPDTEVSFMNSSTGSVNQQWNFNDPASIDNTSNLISPVHTYAAEGSYCVSLLVTSSGGCTDSTSECILVAGEVAVSVPNIFTPNADGNNDLFMIRTSSVKELKCSIFDRWGLKVAELNSVNEGWDGRTTSGNMAPDGVYYFLLNVKGLNEKESTQQGFVQLLSSK